MHENVNEIEKKGVRLFKTRQKLLDEKLQLEGKDQEEPDLFKKNPSDSGLKNNNTSNEIEIDGVIHKLDSESQKSETLMKDEFRLEMVDEDQYYQETKHKFVQYIQYLKERNQVMRKEKEDSQKNMDFTLNKLVKSSQCIVFGDSNVSDAWLQAIKDQKEEITQRRNKT